MDGHLKNFLEQALLKNVWLWFHILAGGIVAKLANHLFSDLQTAGIILGGALIWEVFEYLVSEVEVIYGNFRNFLADAIGDIAGAIVMAVIVVI